MRALIGVLAVLAATPASAVTLSDTDIDALGRVTFAEAGSQPMVGKVAVIDVVLNRVASGDFGGSVRDVINAKGQFEPVMRAGGSWTKLPVMTEAQRVEIATILELKAAGKLGDVSDGGLFFQNPDTVAARARKGKVRPSLVGFGGMPVTIEIADHTFYRPAGEPVRQAAIVEPEKQKQKAVQQFVFGGM